MDRIEPVPRKETEAARSESTRESFQMEPARAKPKEGIPRPGDSLMMEATPEELRTAVVSRKIRNLIDSLLEQQQHLPTDIERRKTLEESMLRESLKKSTLEVALRFAPATIWSVLKKIIKDRKRIDPDMENMLMASMMKLVPGEFERAIRGADLAASLAKEINLSEEEVERVRWGALFRDFGKTGVILTALSESERDTISAFLSSDSILSQEGSGLQDIGKLKIPASILQKTSGLTEEEFEIIKQHPLIGEEILSSKPRFRPMLPAVRNHHERWDGQGYPDGLFGAYIPLIARIVQITDAFDAMISDRPYRKALTLEAALMELKNNAGTQFDPYLVRAFLPMIREQYKLPQPTRKSEQVEILLEPSSREDLLSTIESSLEKFAEDFWTSVDRIKEFLRARLTPQESPAVQQWEASLPEGMEGMLEQPASAGQVVSAEIPRFTGGPSGGFDFPSFPGSMPGAQQGFPQVPQGPTGFPPQAS